MIALPGITVLDRVYESANSLIYRGIRDRDNQPVILKVLKEDYPTPQELVRYKQEYEITRSLNFEGAIAAYGLENYQRTLVIILEDFGGLSLKQLMNAGTPHLASLPEFLGTAIKTAEILGNIHSSNIIHKDINPANIVFNPETAQVKIIDFGISTQLTRENPTLKNPNVLEGTLAYMSPEQTGRMNRTLDYRTDFYSLGVTFYELLAGQLPFYTTDAMELVHCHIAKVPIPLHQIRNEIPQALSDIVMKLMAKTAEERYQSAWGIKADLESCLTQLQTTGKISEFPLGTADISDKFQIPQKLYGREAEVSTLLAAFDRVAAHTDFDTDAPINGDNLQSKIQNPKSKIEMMLVAGYSGIGKSALVQEIYKPITEKRGYFISGKFDQFQRNIPYSAVVAAFKQLVQQLLTESEQQLNQWKAKLLTAFGSNGQVIIDVIPEVELIVGKQPAVPKLGATESQNRFNLVFGNFIRAFCSKEHPLVIFLDDLQWADSATLKLIELMMTDADTQYLFLIGAYRDNEVNPTHPLMVTFDGLRSVGETINFITLASLDSKHISQLIADTLHSDASSVKPLAELVVHKTGGNPFFVYEFLKTLCRKPDNF
jgi:serine/threonine protein kinase